MARQAKPTAPGKLNLKPVVDDQAVLEAGATFDTPEHSESERTRRCYNSACADYRRDRPYDEPCQCQRDRRGLRR